MHLIADENITLCVFALSFWRIIIIITRNILLLNNKSL